MQSPVEERQAIPALRLEMAWLLVRTKQSGDSGDVGERGCPLWEKASGGNRYAKPPARGSFLGST